MTLDSHPPKSPGLKSGPWLGVFCLALGLYAIAGLSNLNLPGLYYDEALDAVPAMQFLRGLPLNTEATLRLLGRDWPLMLMRYVGSTTTYLSMAAFAVFGVSVSVLRLVNWTLGLAALLLSWGFLREYLDERAAAITALLLAVNPTFIFWTRMGAFVSLPMLPLAIAALWALYRWYRRGSTAPLILAILCLGLGLTTKLLFLWFWIGLGLGFLILRSRLRPPPGWQGWLLPPGGQRPRTWLLGGIALLVSTAPLILYNLRGWSTFSFVLGDVLPGEASQFGQLDFLVRLPAVIIRDFGNLLRGTWFASRLGAPHANPIAVPAFVLAAGTILILVARRRFTYSTKRVALLAILLISIVVESALTTMGQGADHLLITWPIPQAIVAVTVFGLSDLVREAWALPVGRRLSYGLVGLLAIILVGAEAWTTASYHRTLWQSGGNGAFSDAIYDLARDLDQEGTPPVVALDWGFARNIQLLTDGRVNPAEWFTYTSQPDEGFERTIGQVIEQGPALYLFHAPEYTAFLGHWEKFSRVAYRQRLTPVLRQTYFQRDGRPVSLAYALEPTPRVFALPATAHPLDVRLGDDLALIGREVQQGDLQPGTDLEIRLYWKALLPQARTYKVFVHLLDDSGNLMEQYDSAPMYGAYPMTEWQPGEVVLDWITLELGEDIPPGTYHLFTGMYDATTGQRLALRLADKRLKGDTIQLGDIDVQPVFNTPP